MNFALKLAFLKRGVRQIQAAHAIGMDPSKLSKAINGWVQPTAEERKAIADYLGRPENELFPDHP
jgi:transcriptional regulator with XRE-family HTH domain